MKTTKEKSLTIFIFRQMQKLEKGEINVQTAQAQANLAKQLNNALNYELRKADVQLRLAQHNSLHNDNIKLCETKIKIEK